MILFSQKVTSVVTTEPSSTSSVVVTVLSPGVASLSESVVSVLSIFSLVASLSAIDAVVGDAGIIVILSDPTVLGLEASPFDSVVSMLMSLVVSCSPLAVMEDWLVLEVDDRVVVSGVVLGF